MTTKITTADCKQAIVDWIKAHPGHVAAQFDPAEDEEPATFITNWKRIIKEKSWENPAWTERVFDCKPYDDQLRATVVDDGVTILKVIVEGE